MSQRTERNLVSQPLAFAPYSPRFIFGQARGNKTSDNQQFVESLAEASHVAIFDDGSTCFRENGRLRIVPHRKLCEVILQRLRDGDELPAFCFTRRERDLVTGTYGFRSSILTAFVRLRLNLLRRSGTDSDMAGAPLHSDGLRIDLAEWLRTHGNRLLRSAYLLCGDRTEAEDLVQETFLQAVKSAHRFRGESAIHTWLHGILVNLNRRRWRKQKRFVFDEEIVRQAVSPNVQESEIDREFQMNRLSQAILTLSAEHREVIVLRYYESLKLQQIAVQAGVSLGTVKSRLHYAMQCLEKPLPGELNLSAAKGTQTQSPR